MRKYHTVPHEPPSRPARRRRRSARLFVMALLTMAAPVVYEWGLVVVSQWRSMLGSYTEPHTPLLNVLGEWWRETGLGMRSEVSRVLNSGPWSASLAVPLALGWAGAIAFLFLRKTR